MANTVAWYVFLSLHFTEHSLNTFKVDGEGSTMCLAATKLTA